MLHSGTNEITKKKKTKRAAKARDVNITMQWIWRHKFRFHKMCVLRKNTRIVGEKSGWRREKTLFQRAQKARVLSPFHPRFMLVGSFYLLPLRTKETIHEKFVGHMQKAVLSQQRRCWVCRSTTDGNSNFTDHQRLLWMKKYEVMLRMTQQWNKLNEFRDEIVWKFLFILFIFYLLCSFVFNNFK